MADDEFDRLSPISDNDNLGELVESLKIGLIARATGGQGDEAEYRRIRRILRTHPTLKSIIPRFLNICPTLDEFWAFIKGQSPTYQGRRAFLAEQFQPLLDVVDGAASDATGQYELGEMIGRGGFGQVYLSRHRLLGREFALKFFSPAFSMERDDYLARFLQEANMLFELNHPNIIRIHDVGLSKGRPFLVMDYFKGRTVNDVLAKNGSFTPEDAALLMQMVAHALSHAHAVGVIHRDLKPANIMVAPPKQCRVIDFGLGVYLEPKLLSSRLTKTGQRIAGDYFTAPELLSDPTLIDPRSDVYSIGAVWYTLVTGQHPIGSNVPDRLRAVSTLREKHAKIILKCLNEASSRFQSCEQLLNAIDSRPTMIESPQANLIDCEYGGGDPRFTEYGKGEINIESTGIRFTNFESKGSFLWEKSQIIAAATGGQHRKRWAAVTVKDPEKIVPEFEVNFEFESDYHAALFVKRCCEKLDALPF